MSIVQTILYTLLATLIATVEIEATTVVTVRVDVTSVVEYFPVQALKVVILVQMIGIGMIGTMETICGT